MCKYRGTLVASLFSITLTGVLALPSSAQTTTGPKIPGTPLPPNTNPNPGPGVGIPPKGNPSNPNPGPGVGLPPKSNSSNPNPGLGTLPRAPRLTDPRAIFEKATADSFLNQARIDAQTTNAVKPLYPLPTLQSLQAQVNLMQYGPLMQPPIIVLQPSPWQPSPWQPSPWQPSPWNNPWYQNNNPWANQFGPGPAQPGMIGPWQQQPPFGFPGNPNANPANIPPAIPGVFGPAPALRF
jgi:hypothetical protein